MTLPPVVASESGDPGERDPSALAAGGEVDVTRRAGRGGLAVAFAKIYFIVAGLVQQIVLPRVLGLDGYGALSRVLSVASITYNPITSTSIQGVSRAVAQAAPGTEAATIRRALGVHAVFALGVAVAFFLLAPLIGSSIGAPHMVSALRILSAIMLLYGLYTPLVGVLNGQRKFLYQAALDIIAATLRTTGLIVGALFCARSYGAGVEGAVGGFVVGALVILAVSFALVGPGRSGVSALTVRSHLAFLAPLLFGQILLNLLLQADLTLLGRFASDAARARGLAVTAADPLVGAYRAAQYMAFLPYQLLIAITFILFPMLATAHRDGDRAAVARYVRMGVRIALLLAGVMVSVTAGLSDRLLQLVFGREAAALGGPSLELLAIGFGGFAIFGIFTTILNSLKRERSSALVTGSAFALVVTLCFVRVRGAPFGSDLLLLTAQATSAGLFGATLWAGWLVRRAAGAVVSPRSLARVAIALLTAIVIGRVLPRAGAVLTPVYAVVVALGYVLTLVLLREISGEDIETVRAVISRRRARH